MLKKKEKVEKEKKSGKWGKNVLKYKIRLQSQGDRN